MIVVPSLNAGYLTHRIGHKMTKILRRCLLIRKSPYWAASGIPDQFPTIWFDATADYVDNIVQMPVITQKYNLDQAKNCEIRFNWLMMGLKSKWVPVVAPAMSFVLTVGRLKYCKPIYK